MVETAVCVSALLAMFMVCSTIIALSIIFKKAEPTGI